MRYKDWIELYIPEIRGILKLLGLLLVIVLIHQIPFWIRSNSLKGLDQEVIGQLDTIRAVLVIKESEIGGKVIIKGYDLEYNYEVDANSYYSNSFITREELKLKQRIELLKLKKGDQVRVKYKSGDPSNSMVKIE